MSRSTRPPAFTAFGLTPEGEKIDRWTLGQWGRTRAIKLLPATTYLTIGEGVETCLAALKRGAAAAPIWAMGPKGGIEAFPVLSGVEKLSILVDNDSFAPLGAKACAIRWLAAKRSARLLKTAGVKDFNDLA
jgi:hypothetical protein